MKQADKGGAATRMNSKICFKKISKHLNEETTYKIVDSSCYAKIVNEIGNFLEKHKANLTKKKHSIF